MAYYKDFSECDYFPKNDWLCRFMAVGWIERGKHFDRGIVSVDVITKLRELRDDFRTVFPNHLCRGLHSCSICELMVPTTAILDESHINLFIPYQGFVFVAPGRIDHHIEVHNYQPPEAFIDAVLSCPSPSTAAYRAKLTEANRGIEAPLCKEIS